MKFLLKRSLGRLEYFGKKITTHSEHVSLMISKMNYLLLITMMVAVIDNSYGRCCPCEKKKGKKIINKDKNLDYKYFPNPKDQKEKLINEIIEEALKNGVICGGCTNNKNSDSKIKFVFDGTVAMTGGNPSFKTVELKFGFCEKHKECNFDLCTDEAEYLFECGHRACKTHYEGAEHGDRRDAFFCEECKTWICGEELIEGFGTHLWCHDVKGNGHYACYKGNNNLNPYKQNDTSYNSFIWICPEHGGKEYFEYPAD